MRLEALLAALSPLLDRAAELEPEARAVWLAQLHREQPDLAAELEALLASEGSLTANGLLDGSITAKLLAAPPAGGQVGPYALVRPLGYGGMGTVWLGRRNDGRYVGEVAIKLLSGALLHPAGAERFRREADALARLTHPNIARLLDAGVSAAGQPFLVLEYVDGTRIDEYCDSRMLSPARRLELFRQVLAAVGHAHASLVVHRDIKPSNILVTADGTAKLLDFGIAKLLAPDSGDELTGLTEAAAVCTPGFAAPEQLTGGSITTATDVYALGLLLYILLAGSHPTAPDGLNSAANVRAVVEREPPRLSVAVTAAAASHRGRSAERLRREYAGDLENILAKALEKTPDRRYPTVAAFGADLDRFMRHEPVEARTASLLERAGKFVRRHRAAVATVVTIFAILVGAIVVTSSQAAVAKRERDRARLQRDVARYQRARATASSAFMQSLLATIAPSGEQVTSLSLLDRARILLERDYAADPRFVARMLTELSDQYAARFYRDSVIALLKRAERLAVAADDPETAASVSCRLAGERVPGARQRLVAARTALSRVPEPDALTLVVCKQAEARLAADEGHPEDAVALTREVVAITRSAGDTASVTYADALRQMASLMGGLGRARDALTAQQSAVRILRQIGRGNTVMMAGALEDEVLCLWTLGEIRSADSVRRRALELERNMNEPGQVGALASTYAIIFAIALGHRDSALMLLDSVVATARASRNPAQLSWALSQAAVLLADSGLYARARWSAAAADAALPPKTPTSSLMRNGRLAEAEGRAADALRNYRTLLSDRASLAPPERRRVIYFAARAALAAADVRTADSLAGESLRAQLRIQQDERRSADLGATLLLLSRVRLAAGDTSEARRLAGRALPGLEFGLGADHPRSTECRRLLVSLGLARRDVPPAQPPDRPSGPAPS
jgi:Serine/threonine protein kinase